MQKYGKIKLVYTSYTKRIGGLGASGKTIHTTEGRELVVFPRKVTRSGRYVTYAEALREAVDFMKAMNGLVYVGGKLYFDGSSARS